MKVNIRYEDQGIINQVLELKSTDYPSDLVFHKSGLIEIQLWNIGRSSLIGLIQGSIGANRVFMASYFDGGYLKHNNNHHFFPEHMIKNHMEWTKQNKAYVLKIN